MRVGGLVGDDCVNGVDWVYWVEGLCKCIGFEFLGVRIEFGIEIGWWYIVDVMIVVGVGIVSRIGWW